MTEGMGKIPSCYGHRAICEKMTEGNYKTSMFHPSVSFDLRFIFGSIKHICSDQAPLFMDPKRLSEIWLLVLLISAQG